MKKIISLLSIMVFATFVSCDEHNSTVAPPESIGFTKNDVIVKFIVENPVYEVKVYATQPSNVDRTIEISTMLEGINPLTNAVYSNSIEGDFTVSSNSVVIPAGELSGSFNVTFNPDIPLGVRRYVTFMLPELEEGLYLNKTENEVKLTYTPKCLLNEITLDIILDQYGAETSWQITDAVGNVVASDGPYANAATAITQTVPTITLCLEDGNYTLTMMDSYGDGMVTSATVVGSYKLKTEDGTILVDGAGDAVGFSISHPFSLP